DILAARPETDPSRIFVTGGSQGGGLSYITAALNPKVTMAVCSSPGLFGLEWKLRNLGPSFWPPIDPIDDKGQSLNDPKLLEERCEIHVDPPIPGYGAVLHDEPRIRDTPFQHETEIVTDGAVTVCGGITLPGKKINAGLRKDRGIKTGPLRRQDVPEMQRHVIALERDGPAR
ncbi:MAG: acetylxylan esterase, partial [Armatimonadetes bacterium]|nr:acetylxylan esterase [Armatimonadota bacterium]